MSICKTLVENILWLKFLGLALNILLLNDTYMQHYRIEFATNNLYRIILYVGMFKGSL